MKKKLEKIFTKLGILNKVKAGEKLSKEEWEKVAQSYKDEFKTDLYADVQSEAAAATAAADEKQQQVLSILNKANEGEDGEDPDENPETDPQNSSINNAPETNPVEAAEKIVNRVKAQEKKINELQSALNVFSQQPAADTTPSVKRAIGFAGQTTKDHLFGIEHATFSMEHRWNKIAANPAYAIANPLNVATASNVEKSFHEKFATFGASLAARYDFLKANNLLDPKKLSTGFTNDFTDLANAGLGDQYVIRRQDALIARIIMLQDVYGIFPRRYGIQDRDLITNAFFTSVSQARQTGEIWKGSMTLQPEMGHVDDAMVKIQFPPMNELERMYIGYLNTEGSDSIKWGMIEWQLLNIYTVMVNEQNKRHVTGIYVAPEAGKAGHYLNASTGVIYTLIRYIHENKLLPHVDATYNGYTNTTMLDAALAFIEDVMEVVAEDTSLKGFALHLNMNHQQWWKTCCRTKYGKDIDFAGPESYLNIVPDTTVPIVWVPNEGKLPLMFLQEPGNIQLLEYAPAEMLNVKMQSFMETVNAWSMWKEGCSAAFTGKQFGTKADLVANNYAYQRIFMNKPFVALAADATTADASTGFWFQTVANTGAKAITDITGAKAGVAYIIECGNTTNATTISKSGKFANITAAYTPTAVGDYIMVVLNVAGDGFLELERCVGGTRTINKTLQPNIPGAR